MYKGNGISEIFQENRLELHFENNLNIPLKA